MNLFMYTDSEKNLIMFLPDDVKDEDIIALGQIPVPPEFVEDEYLSMFADSIPKPTSCIDLTSIHASYEVNSILPDNFVPPAL